MGIPQQVKVATLSFEVDATTRSIKVPIEMGDEEVVMLLASRLQVISYAAQVSDARLLFYRKTEFIPDLSIFASLGAVWQGDSAVLDIWATRFDTRRTAEGIDQTRSWYTVYPYPYILIRQPSLIYTGSPTNVIVAFSVWYLTEIVTETDLTQLMVKDHA